MIHRPTARPVWSGAASDEPVGATPQASRSEASAWAIEDLNL